MKCDKAVDTPSPSPEVIHLYWYQRFGNDLSLSCHFGQTFRITQSLAIVEGLIVQWKHCYLQSIMFLSLVWYLIPRGIHSCIIMPPSNIQDILCGTHSCVIKISGFDKIEYGDNNGYIAVKKISNGRKAVTMKWGRVFQKQLSGTGTSNYIP